MIPISRVRSVTVTSMMFIIPMEPTSKEHDSNQKTPQRIRKFVNLLKDISLVEDSVGLCMFVIEIPGRDSEVSGKSFIHRI